MSKSREGGERSRASGCYLPLHGHALHVAQHLLARRADDLAEHHVLAAQLRQRREGEEELSKTRGEKVSETGQRSEERRARQPAAELDLHTGCT